MTSKQRISAADFDDSVAQGIALAINQIVDARLAELRSELKQFAFKGMWEENREYKAGNFVTQGGALFHCNVDSRAKPGHGSSDWSLVAARGRDGKDGKDYTPPPEPEKRIAKTVRQNGPR